MNVLMSDTLMWTLTNLGHPSQPNVSSGSTISSSSNPSNSHLSQDSSLPSMSEPVKRKRGRPPKKLAQQFPTMTLQFSTSTDSSSPTAELNSNLMVRMGEPDSFTPLMKVSPTIHHKKRRRKSSVSTVDNDLPEKRREKDSEMLTPMSTSSVTSSYSRSGFLVNAAALDNISMITGSGNIPHQPYNTPPHLLIKPTFPHVPGLMNGFGDSGRAIGDPRGVNLSTRTDLRSIQSAGVTDLALASSNSEEPAQNSANVAANSVELGVKANLGNLDNLENRGNSEKMEKSGNLGNSKNPGTFRNIKKPSTDVSQGLHDLHALNKINSKRHSRSQNSDPFDANNSQVHQETGSSVTANALLVSFIDDGSFSFQLIVDDQGRATLSNRPESAVASPQDIDPVEMEPIAEEPLELEPPPRLTHAHTALGIETLKPVQSSAPSTANSWRCESKPLTDSKWDRQNSATVMDDGTEKYVVPQTPKGRDDFYVGYTPKYDNSDSLAYNLTPQFNSMMYSMMSINSPQQKKLTYQQPFLSSEALNAHFGRTNGALASSIDTELLGNRRNVCEPTVQSELSSPDEGDARAALKKVFRLKRDI
ncbi:CIC11C00000002726 [Sungouiella intermedia]|uniref:CIC11C00000002726 n=1 Tax=Sungouiella intermedia TaxID=45354 RepID=A0A1L0C4X4_9ASCO|nr:CIC11C00000002726 [[Candida] intermedia]